MKNIVKILLVGGLAFGLIACDKHDKMDDLVHVGEMAPQVNWTVPNTVVSAGSDVAFSVQYYTTDKSPISHLEVWYNINEIEAKTVSAPWVVSKSWTVAAEAVKEIRISTLIQTFEHNPDNWNEKERAYKFTDAFNTSPTLGRVAWTGKEYADEKVNTNFGPNFMQTFKDSLETYLMDPANHLAAYKDFKNLLLTDSAATVDLFMPYDTISFDENSQTDFNHFKGDTVPQPLKDYFEKLTFKDLISNSTGELIINYSRNYSLDAQMRCLDEKGTPGLASMTTITLN